MQLIPLASTRGRPRLSAFVQSIALVVSVLTATSAGAQPIDDIRPAADSMVAVTGGVGLVPLAADRDRDAWPDELSVTFADGASVQGQIIWLAPEAPGWSGREWTDPITRLDVLDQRPTDRAAQPRLLFECPVDVSGDITVNGQRVRARWLASTPDMFADATPLLMERSPARPNPDDPLQYWRWALIAQRIGAAPPALDQYAAGEALAARRSAELWLAAMDRLQQVDPGLAAQCQDLLTRTCTDGRTEFAAWVVDPEAVTELRDTLLNPGINAEQRAQSAASWLREHDDLLLWQVSETDDAVTLAIVNPHDEDHVARLAWLENADDIPVAAALPPRTLTRVVVDRPRPAEEDSDDVRSRLRQPRRAAIPTQSTLLIRIADREYRLAFGRPYYVARPPGVVFTRFNPPLTLAEAQAEARRVVPAEFVTTMIVRRMSQRWEAFFECFRPMSSADESIEPGIGMPPRGREAVTIHLGSQEPGSNEPHIAVTIPEQGQHQVVLGSDHPDLEIYRRSYGDRWHCRVVFPDAWMQGGLDGFFKIGAVRSHASSSAVECTPYSGVPWRIDPYRAYLDISDWEDLPKFADEAR